MHYTNDNDRAKEEHDVSAFGLLLVVTLIPLAMVTFATGFFPYKPFIPGLAEYQDLGDSMPPLAPFDRVIFMVIDALRSDFVYTNMSGFQFTQRLINDGRAMPFTAHAQAPTVTMPRIKALTTGSIPSFLDMILNIAESDTSSTLASQDTWLAQMRKKDKGNLIMYGDDTWLKLFPNTFARADGTTSFFVSDYTEVDNNVTRHVPEQLKQSDWNTMILHYLGMDHIGHKSGPRSVNMGPKQKEMDDIVRAIYAGLETETHLASTLLVLCGDHGMNDVGNHGGSSPGETSPALLFISPKLEGISRGTLAPSIANADYNYYKEVEQSDVVPTLAGLLGFPVPLNNLGVFIPDLLPLWTEEQDQIQLLYRNGLQLLDMVKAAFPHSSYEHPSSDLPCPSSADTTLQLACLWRDVKNDMSADGQDAKLSQGMKESLLAFSYKAQSSLSSIASNYNAVRLYAGVAIAVLAAGLAVRFIIPLLDFHNLSASHGLLAVALAYIVMMFASSYVEEEQQFWYWSATAWAMFPNGSWSTQSFQSSIITAVALRFLRRWNQSGQKHAGSSDIANTFLPQHPTLFFILVTLTYIYIARQIESTTFRPLSYSKITARLLGLAAVTVAIVFKAAFTLSDSPELFDSVPNSILKVLQNASLRKSALATFSLLGAYCTAVGISVVSRGSRITGGWRRAARPLGHLFLATQSRTANIPNLLVLAALGGVSRPGTPCSRALGAVLLAHCAYHGYGGTNAISSVDLSNAYNGLTSFRPSLVAWLCYASNFGPAHCGGGGLDSGACGGVGGVGRPQPARIERTRAWKQYVACLVFWEACMVLGVLGACCALRTHLFVWTVFSPKFLYAAVWFGGWFLGGEMLIGGFFLWIDVSF